MLLFTVFVAALNLVAVNEASDNKSQCGTQSYKNCINRCICYDIFAPVCGTDNVTYTNECRLKCAKTCGKSKFVLLNINKNLGWMDVVTVYSPFHPKSGPHLQNQILHRVKSLLMNKNTA